MYFNKVYLSFFGGSGVYFHITAWAGVSYSSHSLGEMYQKCPWFCDAGMKC